MLIFLLKGTCSVASQCLTDTFSVTNPGGPAPPVICGTNTGKHMYVDSNEACNDLAFLLGTTAVDASTGTNYYCHDTLLYLTKL